MNVDRGRDTVIKTYKNPCNLIVYGEKGIGKYYFIYKLLNINYKNYVSIYTSKNPIQYIITDKGIDIDMTFLQIQPKYIWKEIIYSLTERKIKYPTYIICRNFHLIHPELLTLFCDLFPRQCYWVIHTEHYDFIPYWIQTQSLCISLKRPSKKFYLSCALNYKNLKCSSHHTKLYLSDTPIHNIKFMDTVSFGKKQGSHMNNTSRVYYKYSINHNKIIYRIIQYLFQYPLNIKDMREDLYSLLLYRIPIEEFILECLYYVPSIPIDKISKFFQYYQNNYRPIFHLETIVMIMREYV